METKDDVKRILMEEARTAYGQGPGFAQSPVVLRDAARRMNPKGLDDEQLILECWQALFREGTLAWGYDLGNPDYPFFHVAVASQAASA